MTLILQTSVLKKNWPQPLLLAWFTAEKVLMSASVVQRYPKVAVLRYRVFRTASPAPSGLHCNCEVFAVADYSELKKLAEAAPEGPWFGPEYAPGTSYVFDVDLGTLLHYESIESEQDACLRYVAAANPAAVLALIAEVERLRTAEGDAMTYKAGMENVAQQRDQLKAETAGLKTGYEAYEQVNAGLRAEVEALRKALAECANSLHGEMLQKYHGQKPEGMHPVTRRGYDRDMSELAGYAAMSKGEQS